MRNLGETLKVNVAIVTLAHDAFLEVTLDRLKQVLNNNGILLDVRGMFDSEEAAELRIY